jgi:hypothetical protein
MTVRVGHVNNLQISPRIRLTEAYPGTITPREVFSRPTQDLSHFFFCHAVIVKMG